MKLLLSFKKKSNTTNGIWLSSTETSPSKGSVKRIGPMMRFVVSQMQFYSNRIMVRDNFFNHLHRTRSFPIICSWHGDRTIRLHQTKPEAFVFRYIRRRNGMNYDVPPEKLWQVCILPSTLRTTVELISSSSSLVTPSELFPGQNSKSRHDLIARVFHLKLVKLIDLIKRRGMGAVKCYIYTEPNGKRGVCHTHTYWFGYAQKSIQLSSIGLSLLRYPILSWTKTCIWSDTAHSSRSLWS